MNGADFLDTNILVYAYDPTEPRKQKVAQGLLLGMAANDALISPQVLAEFSATLLHKMAPPASPRDVRAALDILAALKIVPIDFGVVRRAVEATELYRIHFYDGMIIAAAERGGCRRIWSEDLNAGHEYFGIKVEDPFQ